MATLLLVTNPVPMPTVLKRSEQLALLWAILLSLATQVRISQSFVGDVDAVMAGK